MCKGHIIIFTTLLFDRNSEKYSAFNAYQNEDITREEII